VSVCRVFGGATGAMVVGATNAVTHSYESLTVWDRPARMPSRSALYTNLADNFVLDSVFVF